MYHRVLPAEHSDRDIEQPGMYVSPATFDMHLEVLKGHFPIVHLDEWVAAAASGGPLPKRACAVTFDDGWRDNFEYAFPVLRRHLAPATIFLVSAMTGTEREFWPNRLARLLARMPLDTPLPSRLEAVLLPVLTRVRFAGQWGLAELDEAIVLTKQLGEEEIQRLLDSLPTTGAGRAVLNEEEVRVMAASGLVRFGSHTRNHVRFRSALPPAVLESEIGGSRSEIATIAGPAGVGVFCYPNGDTTDAAIGVVREHYLAAVTTRKGWHRVGADPFLIPRVGVHEDISARPAAFLARIAGLL
jgi:peptidoglycan/xylan/chitin deacetylase (PgdA/CDA1 family)